MIAILPEGTFSPFPLVELLSCLASHQLYGLRYNISLVATVYQQMDMVRCDGIIQHLKLVAFFCLPKPIDPISAISNKFQQKFPFVAAVRNVPHEARNKTAVSAGHS